MGKVTEQLIVFEKTAKAFLDEYNQLKFKLELNEKDDCVVLNIFKQEDSGFDITVECDEYDVTVYTFEGQHDHYSYFDDEGNEKDLKLFFNQIFGYVRDLLSNKMRLIVKKAGKNSYKHVLQSWDGANWISESTCGDFFYNFFGKKSELILQNNTIVGYDINC